MHRRTTPHPFSRHTFTLALLALTLLAATPHSASAGNRDSYFHGNEAAMTAGAITAMARATDAVWYNPAGLGANTRGRVEVTANAFTLRIRSVDALVTTIGPSGATYPQDLASLEFAPVPTAIVAARNVADNWTIALGIFVTALEAWRYSDRIEPDAERAANGSPRLTSLVNHTETLQRYHIGPAVGWQPHPLWRVGAALYVVYSTSSTTTIVATQGSTGSGDDAHSLFGNVTATDADMSFGLQPVLSMQAGPFKNFHVGASIRFPTLLVYQSNDTSTVITAGESRDTTGEGPNNALTESAKGQSASALSTLAPFRFTASLAYALSNGWVSIEGDYALNNRFDSPTGSVVSEPVYNLRAGALFDATKRLKLGGGIFTDRSPDPTPQFGQFRVDYYGATFGGSYDAIHGLSLRESANDIRFRICAAIRYAVGFGEAGTLQNPFNALITGVTTARDDLTSPRDVVFHEVAFHLGTGLDF